MKYVNCTEVDTLLSPLLYIIIYQNSMLKRVMSYDFAVLNISLNQPLLVERLGHTPYRTIDAGETY